MRKKVMAAVLTAAMVASVSAMPQMVPSTSQHGRDLKKPERNSE